MINNKELAEHLRREIVQLKWKTRGELFMNLSADTLEFWIQQFKIKDRAGHSEWSDKYQQNIWIENK